MMKRGYIHNVCHFLSIQSLEIFFQDFKKMVFFLNVNNSFIKEFQFNTNRILRSTTVSKKWTHNECMALPCSPQILKKYFTTEKYTFYLLKNENVLMVEIIICKQKYNRFNKSHSRKTICLCLNVNINLFKKVYRFQKKTQRIIKMLDLIKPRNNRRIEEQDMLSWKGTTRVMRNNPCRHTGPSKIQALR